MGDLSLVGPRPIVWDEMEKYQEGFELYKKVKPGLTGLWQISGRSDTTYDDRVNLDSYYVRNWSVWFDIYILAKTPSEVFKCRGAC
jgi:lipopolysaccharide/colanic/teichoic acid biosynthesis glycosyltransferase